MKIYRVKVNGKLYEVELEAVSEVSGNIKVEENKEVAPVSDGANTIVAPIAGKVIDIKVKVGDVVKEGDCVIMIEAMKLENEVVSPFNGTVKEIKVSNGAAVNNKDALIILG